MKYIVLHDFWEKQEARPKVIDMFSFLSFIEHAVRSYVRGDFWFCVYGYRRRVNNEITFQKKEKAWKTKEEKPKLSVGGSSLQALYTAVHLFM